MLPRLCCQAFGVFLEVLGQHKGCMQSSHPQGPADCCQLAWIPAAKAGGLCRTGIIPLDVTSDTAGPIARTVADAAQLLSVMAGIDSADNLTSLLQSNAPPANYTQFLQKGLSVLPPGLLAMKLPCMLAWEGSSRRGAVRASGATRTACMLSSPGRICSAYVWTVQMPAILTCLLSFKLAAHSSVHSRAVRSFRPLASWPPCQPCAVACMPHTAACLDGRHPGLTAESVGAGVSGGGDEADHRPELCRPLLHAPLQPCVGRHGCSW